MAWSDRQKDLGIRIELTWFAPRSTWRKKHNGKALYFKYPNTKAGYEAALEDWYRKRAELNFERPHAEIFQLHIELFEQIQKYYSAFGVPATEKKLHFQVGEFIEWLDEQQKEFELPSVIPIGAFASGQKRAEFRAEFVDSSGYTLLGQRGYVLPVTWQDRLVRMTNGEANTKENQTINHWIDRYLNRVQLRGGKFIKEKSAKDRAFKLRAFKAYADLTAHITTIDEEYVERFHAHLDSCVSAATGKPLGKESKADYFSVFRMFIKWCSQVRDCELTAPGNLSSREFGFRVADGTGRKRQEKKAMLWSPAEFNSAISKLPAPYPAFLMLMLNCGFRHVDLGELRKTDIDLRKGRLTIQRNKLNQQDTAPVISYPLWQKTVDLVEASMSDDEVLVFTNRFGGKVEDAIKTWWKRNCSEYGFEGKRLDYIRKTGATTIARIDTTLDTMYLGETLNTTAKIHYSFNDGEPCQALDDAIGEMGSQFGFCESPVRRVALTPQLLAKLSAAGIDLSSI